ncbi:MAG: 4a-hydroxytetrahydrobiopterin dehydratase [Candidatus Marinimicrobia bacterium]|jgi:4a-hydroxytetrahydrobiopterin dehydratase|nr:4a-hydroxytetrahydrobiopterin dehydratase [Candidatus Neomarinimicrobiota bacterium]
MDYFCNDYSNDLAFLMFKDLDSWEYKNKAISKTFEFSSYLSGVNFLSKVASLAEKLNHHPDMTLTWCKVHIVLTTHDSGDVTDKDAALAKLCDQHFKG